MEEITFRRLPAMGPGSEKVRAPLHQFLLEIPNLFYFGYVPPLQIVNVFLKEGRSDAGMSGGCEWKPFSLSVEAYAEVVGALKEGSSRVRGTPLRFVEVPSIITRKNEWVSWILHQEMGIPYQAHLSLLDQEEELRRKAHEAAERGDEYAAELHLDWHRIGMKLAKFSEPYMERYREKRGR